ncbi:hypothetical protein CC80DRAFT_560331 [Byssothecium circinans]|uniref:DUF7708 domain-containing protein n=1 Tax=Byssothecium circinans TaxID=147558 RepID=A0A6A5U0G5_9PLEO|nr:hypothetical protein CC80DRAFT_560331 [Byssothecium circinans]
MMEDRTLVRRFTDSLPGETQLEEALLDEQRENDRISGDIQKDRLEALYQDRNRDNLDVSFFKADEARNTLQKISVALEADLKPSRLSRIGIHRTSAREAANNVIQQSPRTFDELRVVIHHLEKNHLANQSKVGLHFRKLCKTFDGYKKAFEVFPSQNAYTSTVCGSLSLIMSAAVNHDAVAEMMSQAVADITNEATRFAVAPEIFGTHEMRELLSDLYAQVFLFYRDVIKWFLQSKVSRFVSSFNETLRERYTNAQARIKNCINDIRNAMLIGSFTMQKANHSIVKEMASKGVRIREQSFDCFSKHAVALNGQQFCISMVQKQHDEFLQKLDLCLSKHNDCSLAAKPGGTSEKESCLARKAARDMNAQLEEYIVGTEGYSLFDGGIFWLPTVEIASKMQDWMSNTATSFTSVLLWVSSPDVSEAFPSSRAAALTVLMAAWCTELPIISHFCERPRTTNIPSGRDVEKVGLIGLIYSLIAQLLKFNVTDDSFEVAKGQMAKLDGSDDSWIVALEIFSKLWKTTPQLSYCIIDGLNEFGFSEGASWSSDLLKVLLDPERLRRGCVKILLTTTGHSRILLDLVPMEDRVIANSEARKAVRGGQWVTTPRKEK